MEATLNSLQEECAGLREKLQTSEAQNVALSSMLGKAAASRQSTAAAPAEDSEELKTLRQKVASLEALVQKQELQLQTLRGLQQMKSLDGNNNNNNNNNNNTASAAGVSEAPAAAAAPAEPDPISVVEFDDSLASQFGVLNTQSKERKKERTTFGQEVLQRSQGAAHWRRARGSFCA